MDRDAFDVTDRAGRALCTAIKMFGMGERLPQLWGLKLRIEALPLPYFDRIVDKMLYVVRDESLSPACCARSLLCATDESAHSGCATEAGVGERARV